MADNDFKNIKISEEEMATVAILPELAKTKSRLDIEKETFEAAYCKLVTVSIVSVFFIIC
jgi:hypothetical protein